jgi:GT2 family glycosyltransferase
LFLNTDTEVQPNWLRALVDVVESDPSVGTVGAKLLYPNGTVQHGGVVILNNQPQDEPLQTTHLNTRARADDPDANQPKILQAVTGACLLLRRSAFLQAGRFDEGFWNGFEDIDLCFKVREKGWLVVYEPRCVVIHHELQSGVERLIRLAPNANRFVDRWMGKITPDIVINGEGKALLTNAGGIQPYQRRTAGAAVGVADSAKGERP